MPFVLERLRRFAEEAANNWASRRTNLVKLKDEAKSPNAKPDRDYRQDIALLEEEVFLLLPGDERVWTHR